jgi:hypothetical protein
MGDGMIMFLPVDLFVSCKITGIGSIALACVCCHHVPLLCTRLDWRLHAGNVYESAKI